MRPLELVVSGFRSFADPVTFDFAERHLVGIVGPIGSGKSSILDAITFAMYGKTPRIERDTKTLINQRRDALQVALQFEVDGTRWKVVRALRRGGAAAHTLYRWSGDGYEEVTDRAREVTERIASLVGLEFDAFRRSVLLAQNQFAAFLDATPTDRDQVLKGVFGFERLDAMRAIAKGRLDQIGMSLQHLAARRTSAEADRRRLELLGPQLVAAEQRAAALESLRGSVMQADAALRAAEGDGAAAAQRAAELDRVGERIPTADEATAVFTAANRGDSALAEASAALAAAELVVTETAAAVEAALAPLGGRSALVELGDLVARLSASRERAVEAAERAAEETGAADRAEQALGAASAAVATAEQGEIEARLQLEQAEAVSMAARQALHEAHDADRAARLRTSLVAGEPCPVCAQTVAVLPDVTGDVSLGPVEERVRTADSAVAAARSARDAAAALRARAAAQRDGAEEKLNTARQAAAAAAAVAAAAAESVAAVEAAVAGRLGSGDPVAALTERRAAVEAAEHAAAVARTGADAARRRRDAAERERAEGRTGLDRLRTAIAAVAGGLGMEPPDGEDPATVDAAIRVVRTEWVARRGEAAAAAARAEQEAAAARAARSDLLEKAGLAASDDIVEVATEAMKTRTALETEVRVLEQHLADLEALGAEEAATTARRTLLERLHGDLADSKFLRFLLDERRRLLSDLAGEHFDTLTAGRYRFGDDGDFGIVDLAAADQVRSSDSLSGGETFLASLALALALAEIVAREGGRLDSFFLDEGFGSLDAEHLDLAMDGVERLVASGTGRLVVVVSHVPAMQDRFEDLIVLDRDAITGETRVVSGSARAG